jgi:hypothetical protein
LDKRVLFEVFRFLLCGDLTSTRPVPATPAIPAKTLLNDLDNHFQLPHKKTGSPRSSGPPLNPAKGTGKEKPAGQLTEVLGEEGGWSDEFEPVLFFVVEGFEKVAQENR